MPTWDAAPPPSTPDSGRAWVDWPGHYADGSPFGMRGIAITKLRDDGPGIEEAERQLRQTKR